MSCVHYKFFSKLTYDTVTFNGLHISMHDLKQQIMRREKLKASHCDLQITNAQTKEEYTDDKALIPRNSSVIVRRIPVGGAQATSKADAVCRGTAKGCQLVKHANDRCGTEAGSGTSKPVKRVVYGSAVESI
ncbi:E3 ubiquitin-protein ligase RBBP6-like [Rhynochetos jubatus]